MTDDPVLFWAVIFQIACIASVAIGFIVKVTIDLLAEFF